MSLPLEKITEGKYEILGKIAVGGVGSIYKVRHRLLDEIRVIKVLRRAHSQSEVAQRRFQQEAKTAIRLKHPNIAQIYDFAVAQDGTAYIVMEFIDGIGLDRVLSTCGPPSLHLSLELAHQTLQAIAYLHEHHFVHRDLSPDNLMLTRAHDDTPLIKIIDLGIVKNLSSESQMTVTGMFVGKARYSSPEQFSAGSSSVSIDYPSDTYSFGVVLYELLTGICPVTGETFNELAAGHLFRPPLEFEESDPEARVPQQLRQLVMRTLEKNPDERPSIAELTQRFGELRDPAQVSHDEFREIFIRAFSGVVDPGPPRTQGTTQGRMDRDLGIDRTTASGTTTGEAEFEAEQAPATAKAPAGGAQNERISADIPSQSTPEQPSAEPGLSQPAPTEPPAEKKLPFVPAETVSFVEAVSPLRVAEASAKPAGVRPLWVILGLAVLFIAAAVGGYFWLLDPLPPAPDKDRIRVERAPVFSGSPAVRTTAAAEPGAEENSTSDAEARALTPDSTASSERTPVAPVKIEPPLQDAMPEADSAREPSPSDASPDEDEPITPEPTAEKAGTELPASAPPTVAPSSAILETDAAAQMTTPVPEVAVEESALNPEVATEEGTLDSEETPLEPSDPTPESKVITAAPAQAPATVESELPPGVEGLTPGPGVTAPRALQRSSPRYPPAARRLSRGATIDVAVLVDETGRITEARIIRGDSSNLGFNEAAMDAALGTIFAPATKDGEPGKMWTQMRFAFTP